MGLSPRQVDELSLWEFTVAAEGYDIANGGDEKSKPPSEAEHDALMAKYA